MTRKPTIVQIKRRADQGQTRPFLCKCDDDLWYWVKGNGAGKIALCREWIAGRIAQDFALPVPRFAQVNVPRELVEFSAVEDVADLGTGLAFASEHVEGAADLTYADICCVPVEIRRKTLVFDWWVQNEDRSLGEKGGNVNILKSTQTGKVFVIDHNLAFDSTFNFGQWRANHVFHSDLGQWEAGFSLALEQTMRYTFNCFATYWAELPDDWVETATSTKEFSFEGLQAVLARFDSVGEVFGRDVG